MSNETYHRGSGWVGFAMTAICGWVHGVGVFHHNRHMLGVEVDHKFLEEKVLKN